MFSEDRLSWAQRLSYTALEEASLCEFCSCKEMNSTNNHMSLKKHLKPHMRPQLWLTLHCSLVSAWVENIMRLCLDVVPQRLWDNKCMLFKKYIYFFFFIFYFLVVFFNKYWQHNVSLLSLLSEKHKTHIRGMKTFNSNRN